jgi:hypothetical protein
VRGQASLTNIHNKSGANDVTAFITVSFSFPAERVSYLIVSGKQASGKQSAAFNQDNAVFLRWFDRTRQGVSWPNEPSQMQTKPAIGHSRAGANPGRDGQRNSLGENLVGNDATACRFCLTAENWA